MSKKEPRFPGIDWWCDNCNDLLNVQKGFSDHRSSWKCKKCGYKNEISEAAIEYGKTPAWIRIIGLILGWLRSALVYSIIIIIICDLFSENLMLSDILMKNRLYVVIAFVVSYILSMVFERGIARNAAFMSLVRYIVTTPFVYIVMDIVHPFLAVLYVIQDLFLLIRKKKNINWTIEILECIIYLPILIYAIYLILVLVH